MIRAFLLLAALLAIPLPGNTQTAASPPSAPPPASQAAPLTPEQAQSVLAVLRDPARRAEFTALLENLARALPAANPAPPPAAAPAPAPAPAPATPALVDPDSLGAKIIAHSDSFLSDFADQLIAAAATLTDFPGIANWASRLFATPASRGELALTSLAVAVIFGLAWIGEVALRLLLRRPRRLLGHHAPRQSHDAGADEGVPPPPPPTAESPLERAEQGDTEAMPPPPRPRSSWMLLKRLPFVVGALALDLLPFGVFALISQLLLRTEIADSRSAFFVAQAVTNAYLVARIALSVLRAGIAPDAPRLRLFAISSQSAGLILAWLRAIVLTATIGGGFAEVALVLGLAPRPHAGLLRLISLAVHAEALLMVLRIHQKVAQRIAAALHHIPADTGLRGRLAQFWHYPAIALILLSWLASTLELRNGLYGLVRFAIWTAVILAAARLAQIVTAGALDRLFRIGAESGESEHQPGGFLDRLHRYLPALRLALSVIIIAATVIALLQAWGIPTESWFSRGALGGLLVSTFGSILITILIALLVWEIANAAIERRLESLSLDAQAARSIRLRTLLPMLRTALLITLIIIAGLMVLSDIGVNIAPLLAGAGIIGVAIGFGSQKLVQDIITGIFLLLENAMQVGDIITAGGLTGTVEALSIRTIRLRAPDGSVHIVPFSAVSTVTNTNRGLANAAVNIEVDVNEDADHVLKVLAEIGADLRADPAFADRIIADIQLWGVDKIAGTGMTITGQIPCTVTGRWPVQREFNKRMKRRFESEHIVIANQSQTVVLQTEPPDGANGR